VFSLLFGNPNALRELYSALEGVEIDPSLEININTLEGALYMKRLNDLSFTIGGKLVVLIEHQSTINPNMPLRILMYIARVYEKIVANKDIYAKGLIKIPRPEIFVLYNGPDVEWDTQELKLSDAFENAAKLVADGTATPPLELVVKMYNINGGHNAAMLRKSEALLGYSIFIDKVKAHYNGKDNLDFALKNAVEYCQERNILKEFLEAHASEVINMLFAEWKDEEALEYRYEEGKREGEKEGLEKGLEKGRIEREKERMETVRNFLDMGLSIEQVAKGTGLDILTIKEIASTLQG
jgi:hypothetical protein